MELMALCIRVPDNYLLSNHHRVLVIININNNSNRNTNGNHILIIPLLKNFSHNKYMIQCHFDRPNKSIQGACGFIRMKKCTGDQQNKI